MLKNDLLSFCLDNRLNNRGSDSIFTLLLLNHIHRIAVALYFSSLNKEKQKKILKDDGEGE